MAEYIERKKLVDALKIWQSEIIEACGSDDDYVRCLNSVLYGVEGALAADVRPVVRGRNIYDMANGHCEFKCSVCGVELSSVYGGRNDFGLDGGYFNFCPNCGARMEER